MDPPIKRLVVVEDDQVVETVASNRADDSFDIGTLPR
jgi:hypothetical protein